MVLGKRGMRRVHLVDEQPEMGGHLRWVTTLPGLGTWARVTQYRQIQIGKLEERRVHPEDAARARRRARVRRRDRRRRHGLGVGRRRPQRPHPRADRGVEPGRRHVLTPEQLVVDGKPAGERVVVYDTDGYYMGATMAERLAADGGQVTYVTPFDTMAPYMRFTLEEQRQYQRLVELGVEIVPQTLVLAAETGQCAAAPALGGRRADDRVRQHHAGHAAQLAQRSLRRAQVRSGPPRRGRDHRRSTASATPGRPG